MKKNEKKPIVAGYKGKGMCEKCAMSYVGGDSESPGLLCCMAFFSTCAEARKKCKGIPTVMPEKRANVTMFGHRQFKPVAIGPGQEIKV